MRPSAMMTLFLCALLTAALAVPALAAPPAGGPPADRAREEFLAKIFQGDTDLPIGLTPEEEANLDLIGMRHTVTPPPTAPVRNPGEYEPMTGVIVRYPWGNPLNLLCEYAEDVMLWVVVTSASQATAYSQLQSAGCNMAHVGFVNASTNTYWTRDYGPWFIVDGSNVQGIADHQYNRPRPLDDLIPGVIGAAWGIPVYGMGLGTTGLNHTGGNYMSDGRGIAMSSRLVIDENPSFTPAQIDDIMEAYVGVRQYEKLPYVQTSGIHHIDCWAKFLAPDKILIRSVPSNHTDYARIEANVAYISTLTSSYGTPYEIYRVYTPNNEPYTNSLIVNNKVLVPMYGTAWDDDAIATYQAAMPGYEVLGFTGSWLSDDAIHCRAMGVTDRYMLYIDHVPLDDMASTEDEYRVAALINDMSEAGLIADSLRVYWKTSSAPSFSPIVMTAIAGTDSFFAEIPAQPMGTEVLYYISATDSSGRWEKNPYIGAPDPYSFDVVPGTGVPEPVVERLAIRQNSPNPFNPSTKIQFEVPADGRVTLTVYSASGRKVATLIDREIPAGPHAVAWNGTDDAGQAVASGVYLFRLEQGEETVTAKGVLLK